MTDEQREQESVERMPAACEPAADISPETIARVLAGLNPHDPQDMTVIAPIICAQAAEIERLQDVLRTVISRAQHAKRACKEGAPISAFNLASGILGQIGSDVGKLTVKSEQEDRDE